MLPTEPKAPSPGRQILVVDDNDDAADVLAEGLRMMGHEVRIAPDGPTALALLSTFIPDVALLDIGLPVMDGYELARRMRDLPALSRLKIVAVTGYGQDSDRARSQAAGFDVHAVKPIDLDTLASLIERL